MNNRMAVRTHRSKIVDGVNLVLSTNFGQRQEMMYVDMTLRDFAVKVSHQTAAGGARTTIMEYAPVPRRRVAFESVDGYLAHCAFMKVIG